MSGPLLLDRLPSALRGQVAYGRAAPPAEGAPRWSLADLAGRFVELSGGGDSAALTVAVGVVAEAHRRGENAAWVCVADPFFPPDAAAAGVDLTALAVVLLPEPPPRRPTRRAGGERKGRRREGGVAAARAALHLLRAGCFAVVVLDLAATELPVAAAARLAHLARRHATALLCLTHKGAAVPSLSPLVSLRLHTQCGVAEGDRYPCTLTALRDRRRGPGWHHVEPCRGPAGLC